MKNLVICLDGTWNDPDTRTNVHRIFNLIDLPDMKQKWYISGVGTSDNKIFNLINGFTGNGTSKRIKLAYQYLIEHYELGDRIFLFGFSRGAFAARSLCGLIRNCGILKKEHKKLIDIAYNFYRSDNIMKHPNTPLSEKFREKYGYGKDPIPIKFMGVWDTVGALGNPADPTKLSRFEKFHDTRLSSSVQNAFQALAICERRDSFTPCIWEQDIDKNGLPQNIHQKLEQRWFIGVHSNIGGGYERKALSNQTLMWMIENAQSCHLPFKSKDLDVFKKLLYSDYDFHIYDETYKNIYYRLHRKERVIGAKDPDLDFKKQYANIRTHETLHDNVVQIFQKEIHVTWDDQNYKMDELNAYLLRKKRIK